MQRLILQAILKQEIHLLVDLGALEQCKPLDFYITDLKVTPLMLACCLNK